MISAFSRLVSDTPTLDHALGGVLSYWGRNTLVFYCVNAPIYPVLIPWLLSLVGLDTASGNTLMRLACCLGAILVNLAVCVPCAGLMNRCFPAVLGRTKS